MSLRLTPAEAVLYRTGPNNISILFEARGGFDPGRALYGLHQMVEDAERFHRIPTGRLLPVFGGRQPLHWPDHVAMVRAPDATAASIMALIRRLALPPDRPLWRAVMVNPDGNGWSGLALHFDHAIADGTRISRHITSRARPSAGEVLPLEGIETLPLSALKTQRDPRLSPSDPGLCRLAFSGLAAAMPEANGHADALLRLSHQMLADPAFDGLSDVRRNRAAVARIESLRRNGQTLGNRARMVQVDLSQGAAAARALFDASRTPIQERTRMAIARIVPRPLLRPIVQREFSAPGIVLTVVPVARRLPALFGIDIAAIHPAAPALGRPPLAVTAVRTGDGFDVCVTAHDARGQVVAGLSERIAARMAEIIR